MLSRTYAESGPVLGRPSGLTLGSGYSVGYDYAGNGRFETLSWNVNGEGDSATYAYVPGSELLEGYTTVSGLGVSYAYELQRDLKRQVRNRFGSTTISQYDYAYDAIRRRENVRNSGSAFAAAAFTRWGYDERNQVTASNRYTGTFTATPNSGNEVAAERRTFGYDPIGNRETALDQNGTTSITYAANELNQYESVGSEEPTYDDDGNLLDDGTKLLAYNAENQLVRVEVPGVSVSTFDYDYIGRRVRKSVDIASGEDYSVTWVYSGWNKIEERKTVGATTTVKNFVWGLDLSQSMEGAGGIGGLIAVVDGSGSGNLFAYDGNGNVSELINADTGSVGAHYEWDAFGNAMLATGALAQDNTYRFSTKQIDPETGIYDYGLRSYLPEMGRWVQRDPAEEDVGGLNLYAFVFNAPVMLVDAFGLFTIDDAAQDLMRWCTSVNRGVSSASCVLRPPTAQQVFDRWYEMERSLGDWWTALPRCPRKLDKCGENSNGECILKNPDPSKWGNPGPISKPAVERFHPGAVYEMRGLPFGGHSNQCTYDAELNVITSPPAMGTVDLVAPTVSRFSLAGLRAAVTNPSLVTAHWNNDVETVIFAATLDGKWSGALAGDPFIVGSLGGVLFDPSFAGRFTGVGSNMQKYFDVRPSWSE